MEEQIDKTHITTSFLVNNLMPSILSDQLFNLTVLGAFLVTRRNILLKAVDIF